MDLWFLWIEWSHILPSWYTTWTLWAQRSKALFHNTACPRIQLWTYNAVHTGLIYKTILTCTMEYISGSMMMVGTVTWRTRWHQHILWGTTMDLHYMWTQWTVVYSGSFFDFASVRCNEKCLINLSGKVLNFRSN